MEEHLSILRQIFSLCLWLEQHTKLESIIYLNGKLDRMVVKIKFDGELIVDAKIELLKKKSEARIVREGKLITTQLMELKTNEHYLNDKMAT